MTEPVWYVYGIVSPSFDAHPIPAGLEDAPVMLERDDTLAALVSTLDAQGYDSASLEQATADVQWLGPRALAHDRVLSWVSDRAAVVPLPMFSLFSTQGAVRAMLRDRAAQLASALERAATGREYALRVYRVDSELAAELTTLSPHIAELQHAAEQATPGQRYLLERKLDAERKLELQRIAQQIASDVQAALARHAVAAARSPIPRGTAADAPGTMILNAAFLVAPDRFPEYQRALSEIVAAHDAHGFRFDFTGPWPAYHFVGENT